MQFIYFKSVIIVHIYTFKIKWNKEFLGGAKWSQTIDEVRKEDSKNDIDHKQLKQKTTINRSYWFIRNV